MQEQDSYSEIQLIVTGTGQDGRRRYDLQSKQALALACLRPGVSLAGMALKHGVNANLLRKWVVSYRQAGRTKAQDRADAFVPVVLAQSSVARIAPRRSSAVPAAAATTPAAVSPVCLRAKLPNGVTIEFDCTARDAVLVSTVIETLGRCDVSSRR